MKKYLLLFLMMAFFGQNNNAQNPFAPGKFRVDLKANVWDGLKNNNGGCTNDFKFYFHFIGNPDDQKVWEVNTRLGTTPTDHVTSFTFPNSEHFDYFYATGSRQWKNLFSCKGTKDEKGWPQYPLGTCVDITYRDIIPQWNSVVSLKIYPDQIQITSDGNLLSNDDKIDLYATPGFNPYTNVYRWQYSTDGSNWKDFPLEFFKDHIKVSGKDLLGASFLNTIPNNIFVRIDYGCGARYSNKITLSPRLSSPRILSVTPTPNTCFGENNGMVKIQFDRPLYPNETLNIFLNDLNSNHPYSSPQANLTTLAADNSFTWPSELAPGSFEITLIGKYPNGSYATYVAPTNVGHASFTGPTAVSFSATPRDVYCHGGKDGTILVQATGGVGNYRIQYKKIQDADYALNGFTNASNHTLAGLDTGTYMLRVQDANGCVMKDASGNEVIKSVVINQPASPLHVDYHQVAATLSFGAHDGSALAILVGGTPYASGNYKVYWTDSATGTAENNVQNTLAPFTSTLKEIGAGTYLFFSTDSNYEKASGANAEGCYTRDTFRITEPPPLTVEINQQQYISCHGESDGTLYGKANGGVEIPIQRYHYAWFALVDGAWNSISQTDSLAINLHTGTYKIQVTDNNNITAESLPFVFTEPDALELSLIATPTFCSGGNNGTATATINGGTAPYDIEWNTGETTLQLTGLGQHQYFAFVKDAHGCQTQNRVDVTTPNPLLIQTTVLKLPTCHGDCNGIIDFSMSGGNPPYQYRWSTGETSSKIENVCAGEYKLLIKDTKGCTYDTSYTINDPAKLVVDLGPDRILCEGQSWLADATVDRVLPSYHWSGPNSLAAQTPAVSLFDPGEYHVSVTDKDGCTGADTISISRSNATVSAEFVAATQALASDTVIFVNISQPFPQSVEWIVPAGNVKMIAQTDQSISLVFLDTGAYSISLKSKVGDCEQIFTQQISILGVKALNDPGTSIDPLVQSFSVAPNPSNGQFTATIKLQTIADIRLRLINLQTGKVTDERTERGSADYRVAYSVNLTAGVYALVLETPKGNRVFKVMIL